MNTFKHVEDYLEILGNYRDLNGGSTNLSIFGLTTPSPINLARYDVNIVHSMASHTINNGSLTDRQAALALKLVAKYKRQFANKGVDVDPIVSNPIYRSPVRIIDRTKSIKLDNKKIIIKFPYEKDLVGEITAASKESKGKWYFDRDNRYWILALTEYNVNWAVAFGKKHDFNLEQSIIDVMNQILEVEQRPYKIELVLKDDSLIIDNAPNTLLAYVENSLGGLSVDNYAKLIDYGPVLGYTVNDDILNAVKNQYSNIITGLMFNKESHLMRTDLTDNGEDLIRELIQYCDLVNRWPFYVYEPDMSFKLLKSIQTIFDKTQILDMSGRKSIDQVDFTGVKCVYFSKSRRAWRHRIPILLSTNAMFYGTEKQSMLQLAEKVVFYTATTYNKEATKIAG